MEALEKFYKDGDIVSIETLLKNKLIDKADAKDGVKILATGTVTKKLTISAELLCSGTAKDAIIKAGGKILE